MQTKDVTGIHIEGHIHIHDPETKTTYVNKRNAIHYENMSIALASSLANSSTGGFVYQMAFGNGGTSIDPTGIITYLTPNTSGTNASLYSQQYAKVVDPNSAANTDPTRNLSEVRHTTGTTYSDLFVSCLLDYGEPSTQTAFDNTAGTNSTFTFDELGLVSYSSTGESLLLTHVIFHPVLKSLNRLIQIDYTVRIQSLTGLVSV
jgi:WD40 repeat protein